MSARIPLVKCPKCGAPILKKHVLRLIEGPAEDGRPICGYFYFKIYCQKCDGKFILEARSRSQLMEKWRAKKLVEARP